MIMMTYLSGGHALTRSRTEKATQCDNAFTAQQYRYRVQSRPYTGARRALVPVYTECEIFTVHDKCCPVTWFIIPTASEICCLSHLSADVDLRMAQEALHQFHIHP